jgi:ERCC4-related helicase
MLPEIDKDPNEDPCNKKGKSSNQYELKEYQKFVAEYLGYKTPYKDILVYHGLGSGKTATAIHVYNMLYNFTPGWNVFILLKAALRDKTWMTDLEKFLNRDDIEHRFKNIIFISYDSPIADKQFMDAVKNSDSSKKSLYIIEEAHNFIRNVYSNMNSKKGKRAQTIYDYILNDKKENEGVRVVLLSGTPAINTPYELALMFNLLRPGTFPKSEAAFNQIYLSMSGFSSISEINKNMFQRRILGLVSYYIGATPDLYATKKIDYVDVEMSDFQTDIYNYFESEEDKISKLSKNKSSTYMAYTRQACNFVFPQINQWVTSEGRPRPNKFRIAEREGELTNEGKFDKLKARGDEKLNINVQNYMKEVNKYIDSFNAYANDIYDLDEKEKYTIEDDVKIYREKYNYNFNEFNTKETKKSKLYAMLYKSSAKMVNIIFNILKSKGPVLVYSNYVLIEGLQIFKIYLKCFGFSPFSDGIKGTRDGHRYVEFHGGIDEKERSINIDQYNDIKNKNGDVIKIFMISSAGSEGLSLSNVRQVHLMEPYWNETRMIQVIGRGIRQCSHKNLPIEDRHVDIYRYKSVRKSTYKWTADQIIENTARSKEGLIQSFCDAVKEAAIDCKLFKAHNMIAQEYKCFQFEEQSLFDEHIGPAYKEDIHDDIKINNGTYSTNSMIVRIKAIKIKAVVQNSEDKGGNVKYSEMKNYWFNSDYGTVYDFKAHYAIGKVGMDEDGIFMKYDKDTYIITELIPIPTLV